MRSSRDALDEIKRAIDPAGVFDPASEYDLRAILDECFELRPLAGWVQCVSPDEFWASVERHAIDAT